MSTFNRIFRKLCERNHESYKLSSANWVVTHTFLLSLLNNSAGGGQSKFQHFFAAIVNNNLIDAEIKQHIWNLFSESQRHYLTLHRFRHRLRTRFGRSRGASLDMQLFHIGNTSKELTVEIWQNKATYKFKLSDIINIFIKSLLTASSFFPWPEPPKNPYTNIPFNYPTILHFYWRIKQSTYSMPLVISLYYTCNFDHKKMLLEYEPILKRLIIDDFVKTASTVEKVDYIKEMMTSNSSITKNLTPHYNVPHEMYVSAFNDMLYLFLRATVAATDNQRHHYRMTLRRKLRAFVKKNPHWGRKIIFLNNRDDCSREPADSMYINRYSDNPLGELPAYVQTIT